MSTNVRKELRNLVHLNKLFILVVNFKLYIENYFSKRGGRCGDVLFTFLKVAAIVKYQVNFTCAVSITPPLNANLKTNLKSKVMAKIWMFNQLVPITMNARKINLKQMRFYEIIHILSSYKIIPVNSPNLEFTQESSDSDKSHLLAVRQICQLSLDAIDKRHKKLMSNDTRDDIIALNGGEMEDSFDRYIFYSNKHSLQIIEEELIECIDKISNLHYEICLGSGSGSPGWSILL